MKSSDHNFMPAVKCPHCGKTNHPEISGWGGRFNTRAKMCRHCSLEYTLVVYAEATLEKDVSMEVRRYRDKIAYYRRRTYELLNKLASRMAEYAEEFIRVQSSVGGRQN